MTATSAGGWAGAGPGGGSSGWKSLSAAVTSAMPLTLNGWGGAFGASTRLTRSPIRACRVAASC